MRQLASGRWQVRVAHGYRMDGSQRVLYATADTREEAERRGVSLAMELGLHPDLAGGLTLSLAWELYREDREDRLAKQTLYSYSRAFERVWLPVMGDCDVSALDLGAVQRELLRLTHDNAVHHRAALSSVLSWCVSRGWLGRNPMTGHKFELPPKRDMGVSEDDWDDDPFAAIEEARDVWSVDVVIRAFPLMRGLRLEAAWLCCIGAGLRVEEALALRRMDVRREVVAGGALVQLAVHHATTQFESRKATKTRQSVRIVTMADPFSGRLWEIAEGLSDRKAPLCRMSASRQNKAWRSYFEEPPESWHRNTPLYVIRERGILRALPYVPLSRMRATHASLMQEAGVLDSLNALFHGHGEAVSRKHYLRGDTSAAAGRVSDYIERASHSEP